MNRIEQWIDWGIRCRALARWLTLALALWLAASGSALGQRKKKEEPAAAPTKSYVLPYVIVMTVLSLGLFAALRPSSRLEKIPEKIKDDEEE